MVAFLGFAAWNSSRVEKLQKFEVRRLVSLFNQKNLYAIDLFAPQPLVFNLQAVDIDLELIDGLRIALCFLKIFQVKLLHLSVKDVLWVSVIQQRHIVPCHFVPVELLPHDLALVEPQSELVTIDAGHERELHF